MIPTKEIDIGDVVRIKHKFWEIKPMNKVGEWIIAQENKYQEGKLFLVTYIGEKSIYLKGFGNIDLNWVELVETIKNRNHLLPTKDEFKEWFEKRKASSKQDNLIFPPDAEEIYSFFSSSHERVVEEIKKIHFISEEGLYCRTCNTMYHFSSFKGFDHSCKICGELCIPTWAKYREDIISLIQPKEDENNKIYSLG